MRYDEFEPRPRGGNKWLWVPAVILLALFVALGSFAAANYKHMGNLFKVITLVKTQYLYEAESGLLIEGAIAGMVDALEDPYSDYLDSQTFFQLQEMIKGAFGGLGILVGARDEHLTVLRAYEGTPAARAGIVAGDMILAIDGQSAEGMDLETAVRKLRGRVGSQVTLTIKRRGAAEPLVLSIVREEINVPTVEGHFLPDQPGIAHIVVTQFTERTGAEMKETLANLLNGREQLQGVVLDLRNNPGGELLAAVSVAGNFVPQGPVVFVNYRIGQDQEFKAEGNNIKLPLALLINGASASASEIVAGAVKDTGAGTLVGERTYGKGVVQTVFPLGGGAGLKLTTARYLTPSRHDIHNNGIQPDIAVSPAPDNARDVQLERAVDFLRQKIAA